MKPYAKFAGKYPSKSLEAHAYDTAACAEAILDEYSNIRDLIRKNLGLTKQETKNFACYIAAMHDIGKLHPDFQAHYKSYDRFTDAHKKWLDEKFSTNARGKAGFRHEVYSKEAASRIWEESGEMPDALIELFSSVLRWHHFKPGGSLVIPRFQRRLYNSAQDEFEAMMRQKFNVRHFPLTCANHAVVGTLLLGVLMISDWIASSVDFAYIPDDDSDYYGKALNIAKRALQDIGMKQPDVKYIRYVSDLYPEITNPRPMQSLLNNIEDEDLPPFMIVEDNPGAGKTEVAMTAAFRMMEKYNKSGIAFFLPTGATSNQAYERMAKMLEGVSDDSILRLVHGMAWAVPDTNILTETSETEIGETFLKPSKLAFFHPFAVGTVDQAELSVMMQKHFILRLFGLSNKVVIIDEVHAYDAYMTAILQKLLKWCKVLKIPVILLSATLPEKLKKSYLEAYGAQTKSCSDAYPLMTCVHENGTVAEINCKAFRNSSYKAFLKYGMSSPDVIADIAKKTAEKGGNIGLFVNTVKTGQEVFGKLIASGYTETIRLFHGRYQVAERSAIENDLLSVFSKSGHRPASSITICTQVCEQSLDISFDHIITELCPIDALIQRLGREHRFLHVLPEWTKDGPSVTVLIGDYGSSAAVYSKYILKKTEEYLKRKKELRVPGDLRESIEYVYGAFGPNDEECAKKYFADLVMQNESKAAVIPDPDKDEFWMTNDNSLTFIADPSDTAGDMTVLTRYGEGSCRIILAAEDEKERYRKAIESRSEELVTISRSLMEKSVSVKAGIINGIEPEESGPLAGSYILTAKTEKEDDCGGQVWYEDDKVTLSYRKGVGLVILKKNVNRF